MKINIKKLNSFFLSSSNAQEIKNIVNEAVNNFMTASVPNVWYVSILSDLKLIEEVEK